MNIPKELEFSTAARHRKKKIFAKKDMIMVCSFTKKDFQLAPIVSCSRRSMGISRTFNFADIYPYFLEDEILYPDADDNSMMGFSQMEEKRRRMTQNSWLKNT